MKKSDKIFFWFTLVFIIYISVGFKLIPYIIKDELVKNLDQNLTQKTNLERVEFNPFTLSAKIHNLTIGDVKSPTISFKEFYVDIAVLRSIFELHPSVQDIKLEKLFVNLIEKKDGTFNLSTLVKPQEKKVEETKEPSNIKFLISKILLKDANIKFTKITQTEPYKLDIKNINYTLYDVGTYNNALSSNNFNLDINDNTNISIVGAFNLQPFKMYGKAFISDLRLQELLDYKKEMLNFNLPKEANFNLALNYNIDTTKEFELFLESTKLEFNNIDIIKKNESLAKLKKFSIDSLNLDLRKQNIAISNTNINSLYVSMVQNKTALNFDNLINTANTDEKVKEEESTQKPTESKPWNIVLKNSNINSSSFIFENNINNTIASTKNFSTNIGKINLQGSKISLDSLNFNNPNLRFKDNINKLDIKSKNAQIKLDKLNILNNDIKINQLTLINKDLSFVDAKNDVNIKSKQTTIKLNNLTQNSDILKIASLKLTEPNFEMINKKDKTNILVKNINLNVSQISNNKDGLKIVRTDLNRPNITVVLDKKQSTKEEEKIVKSTKNDKNEKEGAKLNIGPINIKNAILSFEDKNLPLPFKTTISKLNGDISRLDTRQASTSKLSIKGNVDKYGTTNISGIVDPNNIKILTDVNMIFRNIAMKNFTPYTGKFIGKELASGKLDLNLKYNIKKSDLEAKNNIVITKLRVGKDIKSDDAVSVPVGLAIALLEDRKGIIDLNIPVSGNVDSPEFKIAPIIWKALGNLITKAVTAPFTLLASLFGFDENEIKNVKFDYAQSNVTPIQKETLDKISKILETRPQLALNLVPSYENEKDLYALKNQKFQDYLKTKLPNTQIRDYENKYTLLLENIYTNAKKDIKALKQTHTVKKVLDKKTYKKELETFAISKQKVLKTELEKIALDRIVNIKEYLVNSKKTNVKQINLLKEIEVKTSSEKTSNIDLKIDSVKN